ncbi:hypothetical protein [Microcystis phage Mvi-JY20]|uniref:SF4 helicase domain-containing protein n=1 Tax=Microcystis phage Mvi-JY20 TaxID=3128146 RepID=A0AAX4QGB7_9CAUD
MLSIALKVIAHFIAWNAKLKPVASDHLRWFMESEYNNEWFKTYDVKDHKFKPSVAYHVWAAIQTYYDRTGQAPSYEAVATLLQQDTTLSAKVQTASLQWLSDGNAQVCSDDELEQAFIALEDAYLAQKLTYIAKSIVATADSDPHSTLTEAINLALDLQRDTVTATTERARIATLTDLAAHHVDKLQNPENYQFSTISYPYVWFNRYSGGGMAPTEVIVVAGSYSCGKSMIVKDITFSVAETQLEEDEIVVCVDRELTQEQFMERCLARYSGIPAFWFRPENYKQLTKKNQRKVLEAHDLIADNPVYNRILFISKEVPPTLNAISREIEQVRGRRRVKFMSIDYLTALRGSGVNGRQAKHEEVEDIVRDMRDRMAVQYHCPILTITHVNREDQTQFQSIDRITDTIIKLTMNPDRKFIPPEDPLGIGTPAQIDCLFSRSRSGMSNVWAHLDVNMSTSEVYETEASAIAPIDNGALGTLLKRKRSR